MYSRALPCVYVGGGGERGKKGFRARAAPRCRAGPPSWQRRGHACPGSRPPLWPTPGRGPGQDASGGLLGQMAGLLQKWEWQGRVLQKWEWVLFRGEAHRCGLPRRNLSLKLRRKFKFGPVEAEPAGRVGYSPADEPHELQRFRDVCRHHPRWPTPHGDTEGRLVRVVSDARRCPRQGVATSWRAAMFMRLRRYAAQNHRGDRPNISCGAQPRPRPMHCSTRQRGARPFDDPGPTNTRTTGRTR